MKMVKLGGNAHQGERTWRSEESRRVRPIKNPTQWTSVSFFRPTSRGGPQALLFSALFCSSFVCVCVLLE